MADTVFIEGLRLPTCIGVYAWERDIRQVVVLDLELEALRHAGGSDDLTDTVDYKALSDRLLAYVAGTEFALIEALAEAVATVILAEFPVRRLRLRLSKPGAVPAADAVGVRIERQRTAAPD